MTCFFCKGSMVESTTIHTVELKNCIVVIKNAPCLKCDQCGKETFTFEVTQRLEKIIDKCKEALAEIAVVNYSAA
ncbi:MAG: type II toxin-antitoxin system MqsA family antitoxin [Ruminiclostridium sp.]|nr:type II toxin-antitoxin system MqsA family antitoxin [Ruminiclostridium sp.]